MSMLVTTSAIAATQDDRFRIAPLSGELETPVVEDLKSSDLIGDCLTLTSRTGLLAPEFFYEYKYMPKRPGDASTLIQRRRMLYTAYTKPDAWEASV